MYLLIGLFIGVGVGYLFGKRGKALPANLLDPEEREEFSAAGHKAVSERIEKRKARIFEKARAEGQVTNDGVEDLFCIGDGTAGNYLKALVEEGKLERKGAGRGTHYTPL